MEDSKVIRPDWDHYFLNIARVVSMRSTCNRAQVGAVVVDNYNHIVVTAYNGSPPHQEHCPDDESMELDDHCTRSLHAENNAIVQAALSGRSLADCTWYLYPFGPCVPCQRNFLVPTRARRIVFPKHYRLPFTTNYGLYTLSEANITVDVVSDWQSQEPNDSKNCD